LDNVMIEQVVPLQSLERVVNVTINEAKLCKTIFSSVSFWFSKAKRFVKEAIVLEDLACSRTRTERFEGKLWGASFFVTLKQSQAIGRRSLHESFA
jgi:hypothetical protein